MSTSLPRGLYPPPSVGPDEDEPEMEEEEVEDEEEGVDDLDEEEEEDLDESDSDGPMLVDRRTDDGFVVIDDRGDDDEDALMDHYDRSEMLSVQAMISDAAPMHLGVLPPTSSAVVPHQMPIAIEPQNTDVLEVQVFEADRLRGSIFIGRESKLSSVRKRLYADQVFPRTVHIVFLTPAGATITGRQERTHRLVMIAMPLEGAVPPALRLHVRAEVTQRSAGTRSVGTQTPSKFPRFTSFSVAVAPGVTGDRPYVCDFRNCLKAYMNARALEEHRRIHTGERPYACAAKGCERSFRTATELARHKRLHTGEKPYVCQAHNCGKMFRRRHHMVEHSRMHLPDRPFECEVCKRTFKHADSLKRHLKTHGGEAQATVSPELPIMYPLRMAGEQAQQGQAQYAGSPLAAIVQ